MDNKLDWNKLTSTHSHANENEPLIPKYGGCRNLKHFQVARMTGRFGLVTAISTSTTRRRIRWCAWRDDVLIVPGHWGQCPSTIEKHKLAGLGIGLIDCHLLAGCKLSKTKLLTKDKRLREAAEQLRLLAG